MNKLFTLALLAIISCFACSPKTTAPVSAKMQVLTIEGQILQKGTQINEIQKALEKQSLEMKSLTEEIIIATETVSVSSKKASDSALEMKSRVGDLGKSATTDIYAETAAKDAHKVYKLNSRLSKLQEESVAKEKQVAELNVELEKLKLPQATATTN
jgi:predicted  nucleic acid-binding Zn-ribbon protein